MIEIIDKIAELCSVRQHQKTMRKTSRYKELMMFLLTAVTVLSSVLAFPLWRGKMRLRAVHGCLSPENRCADGAFQAGRACVDAEELGGTLQGARSRGRSAEKLPR